MPTDLKTSFSPISHPDTEILILGSMPGDRSLELNEYYGHVRNRFWRVIAEITGCDAPLNYEDKKALLLKARIGIWDVAHKAYRKGSLDSAMSNEEPNDLDSFIASHKHLKTIGFNGMKAMKLYDRFFKRHEGVKYVLLPSSSPANAAASFEVLCKCWREMLF